MHFSACTRERWLYGEVSVDVKRTETVPFAEQTCAEALELTLETSGPPCHLPFLRAQVREGYTYIYIYIWERERGRGGEGQRRWSSAWTPVDLRVTHCPSSLHPHTHTCLCMSIYMYMCISVCMYMRVCVCRRRSQP